MFGLVIGLYVDVLYAVCAATSLSNLSVSGGRLWSTDRQCGIGSTRRSINRGRAYQYYRSNESDDEHRAK